MKRFGKIAIFLLAVVMVCGAFTFAASAEGFDLAAAVASASDGDTITLTGDATVASTISIDKNLTIDLNGHTLTTSTANTFKMDAAVTLTVTSGEEGGTISAGTPFVQCVGGVASTVNLDKVAYTGNTFSRGSSDSATYYTFNFTDCVVTVPLIDKDNGFFRNQHTKYTVTMTDSTFTVTSSNNVQRRNGIFENNFSGSKGSSFTATNCDLSFCGTTFSLGGQTSATLNNCRVKGTSDGASLITLNAGCVADAAAAGAGYTLPAGCYFANNADETYTKIVAKLPAEVAEGDATVKFIDGDGTSHFYDSLAVAMGAAKVIGGNQIVLLDDLTIDTTITLPAGFKFDLNGKTVTVTATQGFQGGATTASIYSSVAGAVIDATGKTLMAGSLSFGNGTKNLTLKATYFTTTGGTFVFNGCNVISAQTGYSQWPDGPFKSIGADAIDVTATDTAFTLSATGNEAGIFAGQGRSATINFTNCTLVGSGCLFTSHKGGCGLTGSMTNCSVSNGILFKDCSSGTFSLSLSAGCKVGAKGLATIPDGYYLKAISGDPSFEVAELPAEAAEGDALVKVVDGKGTAHYYDDVAVAVAMTDVFGIKTVTLMKDWTLTATLTLPNGLQLDLNGKTITSGLETHVPLFVATSTDTCIYSSVAGAKINASGEEVVFVTTGAAVTFGNGTQNLTITAAAFIRANDKSGSAVAVVNGGTYICDNVWQGNPGEGYPAPIWFNAAGMYGSSTLTATDATFLMNASLTGQVGIGNAGKGGTVKGTFTNCVFGGTGDCTFGASNNSMATSVTVALTGCEIGSNWRLTTLACTGTVSITLNAGCQFNDLGSATIADGVTSIKGDYNYNLVAESLDDENTVAVYWVNWGFASDLADSSNVQMVDFVANNDLVEKEEATVEYWFKGSTVTADGHDNATDGFVTAVWVLPGVASVDCVAYEDFTAASFPKFQGQLTVSDGIAFTIIVPAIFAEKGVKVYVDSVEVTDGVYVYTPAANEAVAPVVFTFSYDGGEYEGCFADEYTRTYSIPSYLKAVVAANNSAEEVKLAKAFYNYLMLANEVVDPDLYDLGGVSVEAADVKAVGAIKAATISLGNKPGLIFYVDADEGTVTVQVMSINGSYYNKVVDLADCDTSKDAKTDGYKMVEVEVEAYNMGGDFIVTFGEDTLTYGLANYINNIGTDLAKAMYQYSLAAADFVNKEA